MFGVNVQAALNALFYKENTMLNFQIGKTYKVDHSRRGRFTIKVTQLSDEWVTGVVLDGAPKGIRGDVTADHGEELTSRISLIYILEEVKGAQQ